MEKLLECVESKSDTFITLRTYILKSDTLNHEYVYQNQKSIFLLAINLNNFTYHMVKQFFEFNICEELKSAANLQNS